MSSESYVEKDMLICLCKLEIPTSLMAEFLQRDYQTLRKKIFSAVAEGLIPSFNDQLTYHSQYGTGAIQPYMTIIKIESSGEKLDNNQVSIKSFLYGLILERMDFPIDWMTENLYNLNNSPLHGYNKLVKKIFYENKFYPDIEEIVEQTINSYLLNRNGKDSLTYESINGAVNSSIFRRLLSGEFSIGIVTLSDQKKIDAIIDTLWPREKETIRMRFGLDDGNERHLQEIGDALMVTRERVRQIEARALRKLRHTSRNRHIKSIVEKNIIERYNSANTRVNELTAENESLIKGFAETQQILEKIPFVATLIQQSKANHDELKSYREKDREFITNADNIQSILNMSVDEFELSCRAYNCLKNGDIRIIKDLVSKSEYDMMNIKNFGKKTLKELKELLQKHGLDFGMKFE